MQTTKKERPIVLSAWEIRAILAGDLTLFHRIVVPTQTKPKIPPLTMEPWIIDGVQKVDDDGPPCWSGMHPEYPTGEKWFSCPYGGVGDRLWGKEGLAERAGQWFYKADDSPVLLAPEHRAASIVWAHHKESETCLPAHMPRWASRIVLEVTQAHPMPLHDITEEDAQASGMSTWRTMYCSRLPEDELYARAYFELMWRHANPKYPWESNCWDWAIRVVRVGG